MSVAHNNKNTSPDDRYIFMILYLPGLRIYFEIMAVENLDALPATFSAEVTLPAISDTVGVVL